MCGVTFGDVSSSHGLDDLIARVGIENTPTGANVEVGQAEADDGSGNYGPDTNDNEFGGATFTFYSGSAGTSGHATQVGKRMYGDGTVGIAPDVSRIHVYSAEGWVLSSYLHTGTGSNPSNTSWRFGIV